MAWRVLIGATLLVFACSSTPCRAQSTLDHARQVEEQGDYPKAISLLETWAQSHPEDLDAAVRLAKLYGWTKRYAESEKTYRQVLSRSPSHMDALVGLGYLNAWQNQYPQAEDYFNKVLARDPNNQEALRGLAQILRWRRPEHTFLPQHALEMELGTMSEQHSRLGHGNLWWGRATLPLAKSRAALLRFEHARRFGKRDNSGSFGAAWKGNGRGAYALLQLSPDSNFLPRWSMEGVASHTIKQGIYAEASFRLSEYIPAHAYSGSFALYWQAKTWAEIFSRGTATTTQFREGPAVTKPSFLAGTNFFLHRDTIRIAPAFGYYEEPFESGAPGVTSAFLGRIYRISAASRCVRHWEMTLSSEYEDRNNQTFVRRFQGSVIYRF